MRNALDEPQTIVVLGGTSDIGLAIARALSGPATRHVVLACRDTKAGVGPPPRSSSDRPRSRWCRSRPPTRRRTRVRRRPRRAVRRPRRRGARVRRARRPGDVRRRSGRGRGGGDVNYTGAVSVGLAVASRLRAQGHGRLVVLSSVAGERVRKANFVYGSSKAGLDAFAQGLGDSLAGSGASVLVVRPGFVASSMTAGLDPAPMATTPDAVAAAVVKGLRAGRRTIWVPGRVAPGVRRVPPPARPGLAADAAGLSRGRWSAVSAPTSAR